MTLKEFEGLYREHAAAIFTYLLRTMGSQEDAMELTQETFFRLWKHRKRLETEGHLRAWLYKVASNLAISVLRKRRHQVFMEDLPAEQFTYDDPHFEGEPGVLNGRWQRLLEQLPPGQRAILWLRIVEGMTHEEIAQTLQISVGTSKSQYHRALARLRKLLKHPKPESRR